MFAKKETAEEFKFAVVYINPHHKTEYKMIKTEDDLEAEVLSIGAKNIVVILKACDNQLKEMHIKTKIVIEG